MLRDCNNVAIIIRSSETETIPPPSLREVTVAVYHTMGLALSSWETGTNWCFIMSSFFVHSQFV